jgi:hypothetical protein
MTTKLWDYERKYNVIKNKGLLPKIKLSWNSQISYSRFYEESFITNLKLTKRYRTYSWKIWLTKRFAKKIPVKQIMWIKKVSKYSKSVKKHELYNTYLAIKHTFCKYLVQIKFNLKFKLITNWFQTFLTN